MRQLLSAATLATLVLSMSPVLAQTAPPAVTSPQPVPAPTTPVAPAPMAAAPAAPSSAPMKSAHKRQTLQERFDAANTTHDGHLTQAQAQAAKWTYINKRFSSIDKDHKGFITVDDIHGYSHAMHATRAAHHVKPAAPAAAAPTTSN